MTDKDFEEMRQQMELLKEKLNRQEVVNEQLMRRTIEGKVNRLRLSRKFKRIYMTSSMVFIPWLLVRGLELPPWFAALTVGMIALALVYHEVFMDHISTADLNRYSIREISAKAIRMKQQGARWLRIGIPLVIIWLGTFIYVVQDRFELETDVLRLSYSLCIGTLVGACLGYIIYRKQQRMIDELRKGLPE